MVLLGLCLAGFIPTVVAYLSARLPYARRALAVLGEGIEAAQLAQRGQRGRVTIGTIQSHSRTLLGRAMGRFYAGHPEVEVFVRTGHSDQIVQMLTDGVVKLVSFCRYHQ